MLWELQKLVQYQKISKPLELKDYRHVSFFPVLMNVYEKLVLKELTLFIYNKSVYRQYHYGYRKNSTAKLLKLRDNIKKTIKSSNLP